MYMTTVTKKQLLCSSFKVFAVYKQFNSFSFEFTYKLVFGFTNQLVLESVASIEIFEDKMASLPCTDR